MLVDDRLEFCTATAATGTDASAIVGDVVDTQVGTLNTLTNLGTEDTLYWVIQVTTSYSGGTSVNFELASDSTANLATSRTTHIQTGAIAVNSLTAPGTNGNGGFQRVYRLPPQKNYERYIGTWKTTVGAVSTGAINSFLTRDAVRWDAYADNVGS